MTPVFGACGSTGTYARWRAECLPVVAYWPYFRLWTLHLCVSKLYEVYKELTFPSSTFEFCNIEIADHPPNFKHIITHCNKLMKNILFKICFNGVEFCPLETCNRHNVIPFDRCEYVKTRWRRKFLNINSFLQKLQEVSGSSIVLMSSLLLFCKTSNALRVGNASSWNSLIRDQICFKTVCRISGP